MKISKYIVSLLLFCLVAFQSTGQNNRNGYNTVLHQPPEVDFSWNNACLGDTTYFTNGTIRGNTYQWYVYDKYMNILDSSTNVDIAYFFPVADTFYVYLEADNGHLAAGSQMIIIDTVLSADFNFMHCSNQFMNHSTCATSWSWDFGDGTTSNAQLPTHQYADTGSYVVTFIAFKGSSSDTVVKQIYVDPIAFPTGAITYYVSNDTLFVHALDSSAGIFYNWNFGDFTPNIYKRDTFHVYANPGTYILNFSDWNTCNTAYSIDTIEINPLNSINSGSFNDPAIIIFPNPVKPGKKVNIYSIGVFSPRLTIYTSLGEVFLIKDFSFSNQQGRYEFDTDNLPAGLYILAFSTGSISVCKKLIISGD